MELKTTLHAVNVRTLAETYYEAGDLSADLAAIDRMQEGLKGHLLVQSAYPAGFRAEVPVRLEREVNGARLLVQGRIDGLVLSDGTATVEEIKTTRLPPETIRDTDHPAHWAQAEIYAYIIAEKNDLPAVTVRLLYASLTGSRASFTRLYPRAKLEALFYTYAAVYAEKVRSADRWKHASQPTMAALAFPFESYREGQREMAARAYLAIRDKRKLLVEAPTGIGKTAAALFPAVKALGEGLTETVFYLTARTTGRKSAENALAQMRASGLNIRSVTITAKRKACPFPGSGCDPSVCPCASGYFDRQKDALRDAWSIQNLNAEAIRALSEKHRLCPFELSLALSETADVIICDYNYVFDPAVRLKRFFDRKGAYTLLIDEAHNLVPRAREMYSARLSENEISALRRAIGRAESKKHELYTSLTLLYRALPEKGEPQCASETDERLINAVKAFMDGAKPYLSAPAAYREGLSDLYFQAAAFLRASDEFDPLTHRALILPEGRRSSVKLWCWNPTPRLSKALKRMRGAVFFSATLSPIRHYAALLSLHEDEGDQFLSLPSPFPRENFFAARLSIPTRFSAREESAVRVAEAIHCLAAAKKGNYLACFPSHAYLNAIAEIFRRRYPDVRVLAQDREMSEAERDLYLANFSEDRAESMVAFIAMGGVFSEGIDLPGEKLIGAAIVGVGIPQISYEGDLLKSMYDEASDNGYETAYVYPGAERCLQAAGRVIRTDTDRGVILFIDDRYGLPLYRSLLSGRYQPRLIRESALAEAIANFWRE